MIVSLHSNLISVKVWYTIECLHMRVNTFGRDLQYSPIRTDFNPSFDSFSFCTLGFPSFRFCPLFVSLNSPTVTSLYHVLSPRRLNVSSVGSNLVLPSVGPLLTDSLQRSFRFDFGFGTVLWTKIVSITLQQI